MISLSLQSFVLLRKSALKSFHKSDHTINTIKYLEQTLFENILIESVSLRSFVLLCKSALKSFHKSDHVIKCHGEQLFEKIGWFQLKVCHYKVFRKSVNKSLHWFSSKLGGCEVHGMVDDSNAIFRRVSRFAVEVEIKVVILKNSQSYL